MANNKLTPKQDLFCQEYIKDLNGTQAYYRAGYKAKNDNTARTQAHNLLMKPNIEAKINELKAQREKKLEIDAEWVLNEAIEIYKIAKGEKPHTLSRVKNGVSEKVEVHKTNLREACKALEIIGKHTSIKAFEKEVDLGDSMIITVKAPKEFE